MKQLIRYEKQEVQDLLNEVGVKTVFSQNSKMRKSSQNGTHLYNWGIPAYKSKTGLVTCPSAKNCVTGCYARSGAYIWSNVSQAYEARLSLSRYKGFEQVIIHHVDKLLNKHKTGQVLIRIHDAGDFYSPSYQLSWYSIAHTYSDNPRVKFYAYTKQVEQSKALEQDRPDNLTLIYSLGGHQDNLIDLNSDRHSRVFSDSQALIQAGYSDTTNDDNLALGVNPKIGLVYHGTKSYTNTTWHKVKGL